MLSCRAASPRSQPSKPKKCRTAAVQTLAEPGLLYHWNTDGGGGMAGLAPSYGLGSIDPTPIATHVVSPDALEGNLL